MSDENQSQSFHDSTESFRAADSEDQDAAAGVSTGGSGLSFGSSSGANGPSVPDSGTDVRIGDHSVHPVGVLPDLVVDTDNREYLIGPSMLLELLRNGYRYCEWDSANEQYVVSSRIARRTSGGITESNISMNMMTRFPAANNKVNNTLIEMGNAYPIGHVDYSLLADFSIGNNISTEKLERVLPPIFRLTDPNACASMARFFDIGLTRYSCMALYAKMWAYVLGMNIITDTAGVLAPFDAWNANVTNISANVNPATAQMELLHNAVARGSICFVETIDFYDHNLPVLYMLSSTSGMYNGDADANAFPFQTFIWPGFDITLIWTTQVPPGPPIVQRPSATSMRCMINIMASLRHEQADAARGFYYASDIIGSNSVEYTVAQDVVVRCAVTPFHEPFGRLYIPRPFDLNVLIRLTCRTDHKSTDYLALDDFQALTNGFRENSLEYACVLSGAIISTLATTVNYSHQIRGSDLQSVVYRSNLPYCPVYMVLGSDWFDNSRHNMQTVPLYYRAIFRLMMRCCRFTRSLTYLASRTYSGIAPNIPNAVQPLAEGLAVQSNWTYTWGNPLAVSRWFAVCPLEWGISAPCAKVTFSMDIISGGPPNQRGWSAFAGDRLYGERADGKIPYAVVTYGAYALNTIHQLLNISSALVLQHRVEPITLRTRIVHPFTAMSVQPPWSADARAFQPCTIMSYSWKDNSISAPFVPAANFPQGPISLKKLMGFHDFSSMFSGIYILTGVDRCEA